MVCLSLVSLVNVENETQHTQESYFTYFRVGGRGKTILGHLINIDPRPFYVNTKNRIGVMQSGCGTTLG